MLALRLPLRSKALVSSFARRSASSTSSSSSSSHTNASRSTATAVIVASSSAALAVMVSLKGSSSPSFSDYEPLPDSKAFEKPEIFYNFPKSQLFTPTVPYPLWDLNWDYRSKALSLDSTSSSSSSLSSSVPSPSTSKVTRHIILVRHGQYDETHKEDSARKLTPLGRQQSTLTGKRLLAMVNSYPPGSGITIKSLHVSTMTRAQETADLICAELSSLNDGKGVTRTTPDPNLCEGRPSHVIPSGKPMDEVAVNVDSGRIETAFRTYFYRAEGEPNDETSVKKHHSKKKDKESADPLPSVLPVDSADKKVDSKPRSDSDATVAPPPTNHEFEIIVCHGNVIRYFFMRALQLPPEAWLRLCTFNCSLTYFTIRPNGGVSCRTLGDIGHLGPEECTFSGHHGFNW